MKLGCDSSCAQCSHVAYHKYEKKKNEKEQKLLLDNWQNLVANLKRKGNGHNENKLHVFDDEK